MERNEFYLKMIKLGELLNRELSQSLLEMYYHFLGGYPNDKLNMAIKQIIENEKYFPPIATFKQYLGANSGALELYAKIEETLRSGFGRYHHQEAKAFMGEQAWKAVQMLGGWERYCNSDPIKGRDELMKCCAAVCNDRQQLKEIGHDE